ncbi:unnamed protein product, partial [Rotaria sp. Silwood2]
WSQGSNRITYRENGSVVIVDTNDYTEHPLWKLNGTDMIVIQAEDRTPFEDAEFNIIVSGIHKLLTGSITTLILLFLAFDVHDNRLSYHTYEIDELDVIICCFSSIDIICSRSKSTSTNT